MRVSEYSTNDLIRIHRMLKAQKDTIEARVKAEMSPINDDLEMIEGLLRKQLENQRDTEGVARISTAAGTAHFTAVETFTISDRQAFRDWIAEDFEARIQLLGNTVVKAEFKEFLESVRNEIDAAVAEEIAQGSNLPEAEIREKYAVKLSIPGITRVEFDRVGVRKK